LTLDAISQGTVAHDATATAALALGTTATGAVATTATATAGLTLNAAGTLTVNTNATTIASLVIQTAAVAGAAVSGTATAPLAIGVQSTGIKFGVTAVVVLDIGVTSSAKIPISVGASANTTNRVAIVRADVSAQIIVGQIACLPRVEIVENMHPRQHARVRIAVYEVVPRVTGTLTVTPQ